MKSSPKSPTWPSHHTWDGVGSEREEKDALERRGFYDGADLRLGDIEQTNVRKRERERDNQKSSK